MQTALFLLALAAVAGLAFIRFAPADPDAWHVDPVTAGKTWHAGYRVLPPEAPVHAVSPDALMAAAHAVLGDMPGVTLFQGSPEDGFATYVARSRVLGFPDYLNLRVLPDGDGATLAVLSRSRFGGYDWGVNRARVEALLAGIAARLGS